jgi:hypothetical protein
MPTVTETGVAAFVVLTFEKDSSEERNKRKML